MGRDHFPLSVMFLLALTLVLRACNSEAQTVCGPQRYDTVEPPDFSCPGPDESVMIPDLNPPPAVAVRAGTKLVDGVKTTVLEWDGAVVHRDKLIEMGLKLQGIRRLRWVDTLRLKTQCEIDTRYAEEVGEARQKLVVAERDAARATLRDTRQALTSSTAWYRSWQFGFVLGILSAGLLVGLAAYALGVLQ
jgi:hypothetical protein